MGRPKGSANKASAPAAEKKTEPKAESSISKAAAVRAALADGVDGLDDIAAYVKAKHGHDIPKSMISAYKSGQKKKQKDGAEDAPKGKPGRKPKATVEGYLAPPPKQPASGGTELLDALETMKPLLASLGKDQLHRIVDLLG
jgi:hypothetical protein